MKSKGKRYTRTLDNFLIYSYKIELVLTAKFTATRIFQGKPRNFLDSSHPSLQDKGKDNKKEKLRSELEDYKNFLIANLPKNFTVLFQHFIKTSSSNNLAIYFSISVAELLLF